MSGGTNPLFASSFNFVGDTALYPPRISSSVSEDSFLGQRKEEIPIGDPTPSGLFLLPTSNTVSSSPPPTLEVSNDVSIPRLNDLCHHWFYRTNVFETASEYIWKPFDMIDSIRMENAFWSNQNIVSVRGGRFDANLIERMSKSVYWNEETQIRRCSWFFQGPASARWIPYSEEKAALLESVYLECCQTSSWNKNANFGEGQGFVTLHSDSNMFYYPNKNFSGFLDDWAQVTPQDANNRPRMVHRGLEGLPDVPDGEEIEIDHLVFVVHGIGSVCDIKLRTLPEVVNGFRDLTFELSKKHFASAHLSGTVNRIEYLPVNWHSILHNSTEGTDEKLKLLSLKSVPKLRSFMNDTLMDILFYTSPIYAQRIVNTVVEEINRMLILFRNRNPGFTGNISLMGHSLGSLILFDILSHQNDDRHKENNEVIKAEKSGVALQSFNKSSLSEILKQVSLCEFESLFDSEGIDGESLLSFSQEDLICAGLSSENAFKLHSYLHGTGLDGIKSFEANAVKSHVSYVSGPAGTGLPSVQYPQLDFSPTAFYALGSPIALFMAIRGLSELGDNFVLPTCSKFYNIFHPFDPVAYRMEVMVNKENESLRPSVIPHHMGRKRMHYELKDTVTRLMTSDFKKKILEGVSYTLNSVYNMATGSKDVEETVSEELNKVNLATEENVAVKLTSMLNQGHRIDYVLQEAPLESFNEYLFALAAHLCYWESEDTCLLILKDIYSNLRVDEVEAPCSSVELSPDFPVKNTLPFPSQVNYSSASQKSSSGFVQENTLPFPSQVNYSSASQSNLLGFSHDDVMPFTGNGIPLLSSSSSSSSGRGKRLTGRANLYPSNSKLGMDPTMPIAQSGSLPPPPKTGFNIK